MVHWRDHLRHAWADGIGACGRHRGDHFSFGEAARKGGSRFASSPAGSSRKPKLKRVLGSFFLVIWVPYTSKYIYICVCVFTAQGWGTFGACRLQAVRRAGFLPANVRSFGSRAFFCFLFFYRRSLKLMRCSVCHKSSGKCSFTRGRWLSCQRETFLFAPSFVFVVVHRLPRG